MNLFEYLDRKTQITLNDIKEGEYIIKHVYKNNLNLVTISKCIDNNRRLIQFEDQRVVYVNIPNYEVRIPEITFNKRKFYSGFRFFKIDKYIAPELFL